MPWLRLDDQFCDHPKIVEAGPMAGWLHVCGMLYCSRLLTDGFIPAGQVRKLADVDNATDLADRLVKVGLWAAVEGGYQVHDYLEYNPSRAKVMADREANAARQASYRDRHSSISNVGSNGVTHIVTNTVSNDPPVPTPNPVPITRPKPEKDSVSHETARSRGPRKETESDPYQVWSAGCEIAGVDEQDASGSKSRQCGKIKTLLKHHSRDDLLACFTWLHDDRFEVDRGIDWFRVEQRIDAWINKGKPPPRRIQQASRAEYREVAPGTGKYAYVDR